LSQNNGDGLRDDDEKQITIEAEMCLRSVESFFDASGEPGDEDETLLFMQTPKRSSLWPETLSKLR
jgi:hypothetical protein